MSKTPFDGRFKILAEDYPELLLRLLGIVDAGTRREVVHVLRELQIDPMEVDHVYRIGDEVSGRLVHFEAISLLADVADVAPGAVPASAQAQVQVAGRQFCCADGREVLAQKDPGPSGV